MSLPITIPYTFATATSSIPLSNLDSDFTTVVNAVNGIGNGTNAIVATNANVTSSGSNTPRTLAQRFADVTNVLDFGAVGNGWTDDATAIQSAIDYASSIRNGGTVYFPPGIYAVGSALTVSHSWVTLVGAGGGQLHDGGTTTDPTVSLKWIGASDSTKAIVTFKTTQNASNSKIEGGGLQNMQLDCRGLCGIGLYVLSYNQGTFTNVYVLSPTSSAYYISNYASGALADACDSQRNIFTNCTFRTLDAAASASANGFVLTAVTPGSAGANTSFNTFNYCGGQILNGTAFLLPDADNNSFFSCVAYVAGTGKSLWFQGADSNYFWDFSATPASIYVSGTASGYYANPVSNCFMFPDQSNGTQYPTLDANCTVYWLGSNGVQVSAKSNKQVIADSDARANSLSLTNTATSLIVSNGSSSQIKITNSNDTDTWAFTTANVISATEIDLRLQQIAGSGFLVLNYNPVLGGNPYAPSLATTASAANLYVDNSTTPANKFLRSTSSVKYKTDVENVTEMYADNVLQLRPVWYRSTSVADRKEWSWYGLLAEDVAQIEPRLVHWSYADDCYEITTRIDSAGIEIEDRKLKEGSQLSPDGVQYERISVLLLDVVKRQQKQIDDLTNRVLFLEGK